MRKTRRKFAIRGLRLKAADSIVDGDLRFDLTRKLARGSIRASLPDLSRWSRLAGIAARGSLSGKADLDAQGGQNLDLTLSADRVATGSGKSRLAVSRLAASARPTRCACRAVRQGAGDH